MHSKSTIIRIFFIFFLAVIVHGESATSGSTPGSQSVRSGSCIRLPLVAGWQPALSLYR